MCWPIRLFLFLLMLTPADFGLGAKIVGRVLDKDTDLPLAARVYLQTDEGDWLHVSMVDEGEAIRYEKRRGSQSVEIHTTVSPHPFVADVPAGRYTLLVEKGKEYAPERVQLTVAEADLDVTIQLRRWVDMQSAGWFSGETHVHRSLEELPLLVQAENLHVTFPLTYWVTQAYAPPRTGEGKSASEEGHLIRVDDQHVIYPRNTEYEIFTVNGKRHTLGAIFALNHKSIFERGVPPVAPIAEQVRQEGGLLELDKHNWPWSMMLVPVMQVDLYELTNNHIWKTPFAFADFGEQAAEYMRIEQDEKGFTENGWIDFTWKNYYALLNCGFDMKPTAGTASGVHPVPLGFGRVYVHLPDGFSYEAWVQGLAEGRSFVTTGPMLEVTANGNPPGSSHHREAAEPHRVRFRGRARSLYPLERLEIVANGIVVSEWPIQNQQQPAGGYETRINLQVSVPDAAWFVVRCVSRTPEGRPRFAHTAPFHFRVEGRSVRPRKEEVEYLIERVERELKRHRGVLNSEAVAEFEQALTFYQGLLPDAR